MQPGELHRAKALRIKLSDHLGRNDAYSYFQPVGDLLDCGPNHTNVNDFQALLVVQPAAERQRLLKII